MMKARIRSRALTVASVALLVAGCATVQIQSTWRAGQESPIPAPGAAHALFSSIDLSNTLAGIQNDSNYIYVELRTTNKEISRTIMRRGLTVWFDPRGGKEKKFGIHYPAGPRWNEASTAEGTEGGTIVTEASDMVELFEAGNDEPHRMTLASTGGIEASTRMQRDTMSYVLKVPLREDMKHPFAVRALPGASIALGVESSPRLRAGRAGETPPEEGGRGGSGRRGGGSGRKGRPNGGEGRGPRGTPEQADQSFEIWLRVNLAGSTRLVF